MRSVSYVVRPLQWIGETPTPQRSPFRAVWTATLDVLDRELWNLDASNVVLQMDVTEGQIRRDGEIRADARASSPRVRLLFDSKRGPLAFQCGTWWDWRDNVRAIALGLEALRKVDRYGITTGGEQYKGYLAIEGSDRITVNGVEDAQRILRRWSRLSAEEAAQASFQTLWRRARANAHPDRNEGEREGWDFVEAAAATLGLS